MEISKNYQPELADDKWYQHWQQKGYFHSEPDDRPAYSIVMPPPNVTGVLHMGHALNNTVQDILIRRAKMKGYNTCWVPGTDHASIATEAKVVSMLREKGIDKNELSRDAFLKYAWEWKEKYGGIILEQLKKLGCSLDWDRTAFTMDEDYSKAVINVFVDLFQKGKIYRGAKMINWDPQAMTALSDEEVIHKETNSKLTYVRYKIDGDTEEYITIATVRPETILGDTAVCVHPEDPRYAHLKGRFCFVPLINRRIPIIFDEYIDREFGTGALKVTPAHDINDYNLGIKYNLEVVDTLNADGTLSEIAGRYVGEDRFTVREKIVEDLKTAGNFVKQEDYTNQVGYSERTNAVVEPRISMQWWCNMGEMAHPALKAVMEDIIKFYPEKYKNLYRHWMGNIKDWCISRQLWWGHRIPAWYDTTGKIYVAANEEEALAQYLNVHNLEHIKEGEPFPLRQDEDVLDTWFSSWLWPLQVFGWNENPDNATLEYYYPTQVLVTAPEIIFFWVARMVMSGYEYKGQHPFNQVYFTGIVRDKLGRKMSKQLGNSPDLLQLIAENGADAVRFAVLITSPAGNDILFDTSLIEQGRFFLNKIWNAMKLVKLWEEKVDESVIASSGQEFALEWMKERIHQSCQTLSQQFDRFQLSEGLKEVYSLIWNDFCSSFLEWIKPGREEKIAVTVYQQTLTLFESLLQLLHPFMPFVTEEIFHLLREQKEDVMNLRLPEEQEANHLILQKGALLQQLISAIRDTRNKNQIVPKESIQLFVATEQKAFYDQVSDLLKKQINADEIAFTEEAINGCIHLVCGTERLFLKSNTVVDTDLQKAKMEKELEHLKGFLESILKKLSNERFISNAKPEIIEREKTKQADTLAKIKTLEESLALL